MKYRRVCKARGCAAGSKGTIGAHAEGLEYHTPDAGTVDGPFKRRMKHRVAVEGFITPGRPADSAQGCATVGPVPDERPR
jgi:hypothetical protein